MPTLRVIEALAKLATLMDNAEAGWDCQEFRVWPGG